MLPRWRSVRFRGRTRGAKVCLNCSSSASSSSSSASSSSSSASKMRWKAEVPLGMCQVLIRSTYRRMMLCSGQVKTSGPDCTRGTRLGTTSVWTPRLHDHSWPRSTGSRKVVRYAKTSLSSSEKHWRPRILGRVFGPVGTLTLRRRIDICLRAYTGFLRTDLRLNRMFVSWVG